MSRRNRNTAAPAAGDPSLAGGTGPGADALDDTIEGAEDGAGDDGAPLDADERAELEALRAENAALKKKRKGPPAAAAEPAAGPAPALPRWVGTIKYGVDIVVEAIDAVHAEQEYKRASGIIRSEHPVEISPAPAGAEPGHVGGR